MYNMKKILLPLLLLVSLMAYAKPVDMSALTQIASRFYGVAGDAAVSVSRIGGEMVLFRWEDGFVMLASDDCVRPVLAYSQRSSFDPEAMPAHVAEWVEGYRREIASVVAAGISQSASVAAEWAYWLRGADVKSVGDSVGPMLTTAWNQGWGFNAMCPYDENDSVRCYTGCTATATAQIMNYWQHPTVGWGSFAYQHPLYGVLSANFGATTYQWGLMPDTITSVTPDSNIQALALLMYHVGVAVGMNYGTHGSGAAVNAYGSATRPSSENALKTYFKYSPMLYSVFKSEFTDAEWDSIMYGEILAGRPVLYAGHDTSGGHAFVLDGYHEVGDSMASRLFFHVNWGWGGHYDGFYTLDSLAPGAGGIGGNATYTFNMTNSAVVGIAPADLSSDTLVTVSVAPNNIAGGTVSGSGDYIPFEDRVTLWAHAAEGYRFVCWQSGSTQNPVTFLANGDVVDTAIFERLGGDTLGYCFDGLVTSWADDYGSTTEWGIRIPPSMRNVGRNISAVQLFPYVRGVHTVNIYIGNDIATATLVHTKQIIVGDAEYYQWGEFALDTTLPVGSFDVVWVTVSYTGAGYPAASSRYSGNSDGSWYRRRGYLLQHMDAACRLRAPQCHRRCGAGRLQHLCHLRRGCLPRRRPCHGGCRASRPTLYLQPLERRLDRESLHLPRQRRYHPCGTLQLRGYRCGRCRRRLAHCHCEWSHCRRQPGRRVLRPAGASPRSRTRGHDARCRHLYPACSRLRAQGSCDELG